jgi:DNA-binding NarL/FixJ family response regulator
MSVAAGLKTFIVEDSAIIRENLIATLEETTPVRVVGTAEAEEGALDWLSDPEHDCALVIVDVVLKRGTGLGLLRSEAVKRPARRFVVLTNYASADLRQRCTELGADRVFDKSSELDDLIAFCSEIGTDAPTAGPSGPAAAA